jgi:uncharacterized membrane protein YsdA (DUF1294 family)/cold shock CspA family protein
VKETGELVDWNDDRGFGFIRADGGERVFVHIKSIRRIATRPRIGDRLSFTRGIGRDGRPAATNAEISGANPQQPPTRRGAPPAPPLRAGDPKIVSRVTTAAVLLALVLFGYSLGRAGAVVGIAYLVMGLVSVLAYWVDKHAAETGRWRTPESTLHGIDLACGIMGGLVAQATLRHKISKSDFTLVTFGIALLHFCALAALILGFYEIDL